ncbi:MAG TPA: DUF3566 domain-containing protein [Mycobacterium sp.]|nr:MAG: hypothetical protein E6Q56_04025 [Mycobacterium sp.]HOB50318.1 DUF3566 domain-containing protein [Mycobacterium sp.]HPZ94419.1 DUF3566 domain-containing protein [Mycobacterium sp.]HQE14665.1 DUF3566 domain-containing protein [Mycobacterium sp.]
MSSPKEPGLPAPGDRPGSGDASTDVPPWQGARRPESPARPPAPRAADPRTRYVTGIAAPDLSAAGPVPQRPDPVPVPGRPEPPSGRPEPLPVRSEPVPSRPETRSERTEVTPAVGAAAKPPEAYASELPDLTGPLAKPAPVRRPPAEPPLRQSAPRPGGPAAARSRGPVRASMQIRRIDPWSTLKVSGLLSIALFFIWMIAVALLYLVLGAMGVWSKLNSNVGDLLTSGSGAGGEIVSAGSIFGSAALIGLVNIVLLTAMATIGAYIYNLSTDMVGGVEVTLADLD